MSAPQPLHRLQRADRHQRSTTTHDRNERDNRFGVVAERHRHPAARATAGGGQYLVETLGQRPDPAPTLPTAVASQHAGLFVGLP